MALSPSLFLHPPLLYNLPPLPLNWIPINPRCCLRIHYHLTWRRCVLHCVIKEGNSVNRTTNSDHLQAIWLEQETSRTRRGGGEATRTVCRFLQFLHLSSLFYVSLSQYIDCQYFVV